MIQFRGPEFARVDNRLLALQLVEKGLTNAAMFMPSGELVQPADILYKRSILVERGSFRPLTKVTEGMIRHAQAQFIQQPHMEGTRPLVLLEMTLKNLNVEGRIDHQDFLDRVDLIGTLGHPVLISKYGEFYRLAGYLFRYTKLPIGIVMGVPTLRELFEERYYTDLEGGILESFGRMFKNDLKLFVYPFKDPNTGSIITARNLRVAPHIQHLYDYLLENQHVQSVRDVDEGDLSIFSRDVLRDILANAKGWEGKVPAQVAELIRSRRLLGYRG
jgi:hypothetical protein